MKFLIDENLSPQLAVLLVRALIDRRPPELTGIILANLDTLEKDLRSGAIAAFTQTGIRVRTLPLR